MSGFGYRFKRTFAKFEVVHIGSKLFVAVYGESEVAEPICTAHARDLLVCVSVVVQCTNVVFKMTALTTDSVTNTDNT